jgi:two-component system, cell cycle response regulator CpdR
MYHYVNNVVPYPHALVVEDEKNISSLIQSVLEKNHFEVDVFDDPFLSLALFNDDPVKYGLVIYDMSIKQLSAFEFLRQVRAINPDVKFVLITTVAIKPAEFNKVLPSITIDGFLEKQSLSGQLLSCVNKILGPRKIGKANIGKYR